MKLVALLFVVGLIAIEAYLRGFEAGSSRRPLDVWDGVIDE